MLVKLKKYNKTNLLVTEAFIICRNIREGKPYGTSI